MPTQFQRTGFIWLPSSLLRDDWLVSRLAVKVFFISAVLVIAMTPIFVGVDTTNMTFWHRLPWGILGIIGPIGIVSIWLGMWRYWLRLDTSPKGVKRVWFLVLLIGFWWGSCAYYFLAYLPQVMRRSRGNA